MPNTGARNMTMKYVQHLLWERSSGFSIMVLPTAFQVRLLLLCCLLNVSPCYFENDFSNVFTSFDSLSYASCAALLSSEKNIFCALTLLMAVPLNLVDCDCIAFSVWRMTLPANFSLSNKLSLLSIGLQLLSVMVKSLSKSYPILAAASRNRGSNDSGSLASRVYTTTPPYPSHASFEPR